MTNKRFIYEHVADKIPFNKICDDVVILRGLAHSHYLFSKYGDILKNLTFLIRQSWHHNDQMFKDGLKIIEENNLDINNFYFLHNTIDELERAKSFGFKGIYCNANCFQNENNYVIEDIPKRYKAVYNARFDPCKRHEMLVPDREDIALVSLRWPDNINDIFKKCDIKTNLNYKEISRINNESYYGLCLSYKEGQCRAAIEYLYCGIPIISTPSKGGRDVWYTDDNHIIVEPSKEDINDALNTVNYNYNRQKIRDDAITLAKEFRQNLFDLLDKLDKKITGNIYKFSKGNPDRILKELING